MNYFGFEPDFENFRNTLFWKSNYRVPNIELVVDREIKEAFLGREVTTLKDEIDFRYRAGYDYVWISKGMIDPAGTINKEFTVDEKGRHFEGKDYRVWAEEHQGTISNFADFKSYRWPKLEEIDLADFDEAGKILPEGMKVVAVCGKIFTAAWMLMGFENFAVSIHENPKLPKALLEKIAGIQLEVFEKVVRKKTVGAVWAVDDIAYHTGPMLAPAWYAETLFPYYKIMGKICRELGKPFIYHSDGNLLPVLEMIIGAGFNALHPIEPESMDIYRVREIVGERLCLLGNIRVHTLATGTPEEIKELALDRINNLGSKGGYCLGSSNSVPNYIPLKNYLSMLEANAGEIR